MELKLNNGFKCVVAKIKKSEKFVFNEYKSNMPRYIILI